IGVVGNQVAVLLGSDVTQFDRTLANLKDGKGGLGEGKMLAAFEKRADRERTAEMHGSAQAFLGLLATEGKLPAKLSRGPPAQARTPTRFSCLACADDGSALVGGAPGQVVCYGADLLARWSRGVAGKVLSVALDPLGRRLAVADSSGGVSLFDAEGKHLWRTT